VTANSPDSSFTIRNFKIFWANFSDCLGNGRLKYKFRMWNGSADEDDALLQLFIVTQHALLGSYSVVLMSIPCLIDVLSDFSNEGSPTLPTTRL